jgi:hypothetical protein
VSLARTRGVFERDVLPGHLARTRWYPERSAREIRPTVTSAIPFCDIGDNRPWLAFFEATTERGATTRYVLPMQIDWVRFDRERYNPRAFAAVRQGAREGTLLDVATDPIFIALLLRNLRNTLTVEEADLRLEFRPTSKFSDQPINPPGRRVAEMHLALSGSDEFADFAPEPTRPKDVKLWIEDAIARAERVFDALRQRRDGLREVDRQLIDQTLAQRAALHDRLHALLPRTVDSLNIRHHGDFHLGQMLIVKDDIFIIDFEGEPRRPLDERRRRAPAARDVAGLIRSIDYSATAALGRALKVAPDEQGKLGAALAEWRDRAVAAFLDAYREIMTDQRLWPADTHAAEQMLNFFLLEKVLYEIEYELAHRPDWLRVPLTGMLRILSQHSDEAS